MSVRRYDQMKKGMIPGLTAIALLTSGCCACPSFLGYADVRGSGNVVTETRRVIDFDRVSLAGSGRVIITQGDDESLTVEADDNLMQYIKAEVEGRTLVLGFTDTPRFGTFRPSRTTEFNVTLKALSGLTVFGSGDIETGRLQTKDLEIKISGSGDIEIESLKAEQLEVLLSGSGNVDLMGNVAEQSVQITGSGKYRAGDLESQRAEVQALGSGGAVVWATDTLDVRITGSGDVEYYGHPRVTQHVTGSGDVRDRGGR